MADQIYHLADGIVVGTGAASSLLINLHNDDEIKISDVRFAEMLEQLSLGSDMDGNEDFLPRMIRDGYVSQGPARVDTVLRERLSRMDRMFMREYEDHLSTLEREAYEKTLDAHARRKRFFNQVGQCPTLPETSLRRALLIGDASKVGRKRVLCVGDDDLVSVALAVLGHEVTVYDIDEFLLGFLEQTISALGLDIEVAERDLRDPLKADEHERFDAFVTDPMSNRDCFAIFLSRAFSMLVPGGEGFVAVYAPCGRLFGDVAREMRFAVGDWHARHNRYYSHYLKLHTYESDWVRVRKRDDTRLLYAADELASPPDLYAEAFYQRKPTFVAFYDDIENVDRAVPLFLDLLVDVMEQTGPMKLIERTVHPGERDWTVVHGATQVGHLTLHVDRRRRQLSVELYPTHLGSEQSLRDLLINAYKPTATNATMSNDRDVWDLRMR